MTPEPPRPPIDFEFHRREAAHLRRVAINASLGALWRYLSRLV